MVFASFTFLFGFLPILLVCYFATPPKLKNLTLLFFSYVFYGWWRLDFCLLLLASTALDFWCGGAIGRTSDARARKRWLALSVVSNLALLGYFKYANFGVSTLNEILVSYGLTPVHWANVLLPVGISFITFQTMSYTIDVYRRDAAPSTSLLDFATYVSLFPQLVAGPIVRYRTVAHELKERSTTWQMVSFGFAIFIIGFAKKVLIANNLGLAADEAFNAETRGYLAAWVGLLAYTFQIYFDFSGYSDMAIGLGALLGFRFPENFDSPYQSASITEFWRRWHITLSTWIRDYLYIPLGGNRGTVAKTYRNLAISMVLCGLWHGANWTFLAWGAYHAFWLIGERLLRNRVPHPPRILRHSPTFLVVAFGWVLFRSDNIGVAREYLVSLFRLSGPAWSTDSYWTMQPWVWGLLVVAGAITSFAPKGLDIARRRHPASLAGLAVVFMIAVADLVSQGFNPFLYFQF